MLQYFRRSQNVCVPPKSISIPVTLSFGVGTPAVTFYVESWNIAFFSLPCYNIDAFGRIAQLVRALL